MRRNDHEYSRDCSDCLGRRKDYAEQVLKNTLPARGILNLLGIDRHLTDRPRGGSRIDAVFMVERSINGLSPEERLAVRRKDVAPLVNDLIDLDETTTDKALAPP
jgi:hypothetical protein